LKRLLFSNASKLKKGTPSIYVKKRINNSHSY
jgi:hypothetical protein